MPRLTGVKIDREAIARRMLSARSSLFGAVRWRDCAVSGVLDVLGLVWLAGDRHGLPVVGGGVVLVAGAVGPLVVLGRAPGVALAVSLSANLSLRARGEIS